VGIRLVADHTVPAPHPVEMTLTCDGDHGLLPNPVEKFDVSHDAPQTIAVRAGWKFSYGDEMQVLCPECAGRRRP
jgi:hypothetical protein